MYKLTSKRLLFCSYLPCSEDSEKGSCSEKRTKLEQHVITVFRLFAAHEASKKLGVSPQTP